jgi:hypothetical protein
MRARAVPVPLLGGVRGGFSTWSRPGTLGFLPLPDSLMLNAWKRRR